MVQRIERLTKRLKWQSKGNFFFGYMLIWPWWIPNCLSHFQDVQVWHKVSKDIEQVLEMHNIKLITHEEQSAQNIECTFTKLKTHNMANIVLTSLTMLLSFQCIVMTNEIEPLMIHNNLFWKFEVHEIQTCFLTL